ncbi:hypothetical protein ID866_10421 [Astraeus odoratus]|nr:hypothetical protein ID866_10421 [Astraeus odoratus]
MGLLVYHVYCDINNTGKNQCIPVSQPLLAAFLSSCTSAYSSSSVASYAARIWA